MTKFLLHSEKKGTQFQKKNLLNSHHGNEWKQKRNSS